MATIGAKPSGDNRASSNAMKFARTLALIEDIGLSVVKACGRTGLPVPTYYYLKKKGVTADTAHPHQPTPGDEESAGLSATDVTPSPALPCETGERHGDN